MPRIPLLTAVVLALTLGAPFAMATETWELGAQGWNTLEAPDPLTPAGQLQLLRRDLIAAQTGQGAGGAPVNLKLEAFFKKNPKYLLDDQGRPLQGKDLVARHKFWHAMLFSYEKEPESPVGKPAETVQEKVELWLKANPRHELEGEARLLLGDAKFARKKYWQALYDYEFVARNFTATPSFVAALDRERRLAEIFLGGWKRNFIWMPLIPTREEGVELLVRIQERAPGSAIGEESSLRLGAWYFETADMEMAVEAYGIFLQNYPASSQDAFVLRRIIEASLARFSGPRFDSTGLIEARQRIVEFQKKYPVQADQMGCDALLVRIEESLAQRDFYSAHWYERRGEIVSAAVLYRRILVAHATTQAAVEAKAKLEALKQPLVDARDPAAPVRPGAPVAAPTEPAGGTP